MTKSELVKELSTKVEGASQKDVKAILDAFETVTKETLAKGDKISLTGFMTIETKDVAERETFVNPRQQELGKKVIPAHKGVKVKIGKSLKECVK